MTSEDRDFPRPIDVEESRSLHSAGANPGGAAEQKVSGRGGRKGAGKAPKKQLPLWLEAILMFSLAMAIAVFVKAFFVQAFYIPSESMEPGLVKDDRILVQKVSYWNGEPQRGDVVVFKDPGGWLPLAASQGPSNPIAKAMTKVGLYPEGGHLVKRVIGVAGDVVECCDDDGNLKVNGVSIEESAYVKQGTGAQCNGPMRGDCDWESAVVPEGHVFVMGDNRSASADSSWYMCAAHQTDCVSGREFVPVDNVVGKFGVVIWPFSNMRVETNPGNFDVVEAR